MQVWIPYTWDSGPVINSPKEFVNALRYGANVYPQNLLQDSK